MNPPLPRFRYVFIVRLGSVLFVALLILGVLVIVVDDPSLSSGRQLGAGLVVVLGSLMALGSVLYARQALKTIDSRSVKSD